MSKLFDLIKFAFAFIPVLLLVVLNGKNNLKKTERSRQILMPVVALIYAVVVIVLLSKAINWCYQLTDFIADKLALLKGLGNIISTFADSIIKILKGRTMYLLMVALNFLVMLGFITIKRIVITVFRQVVKPDTALFDNTAPWFFECDEEDGDGIWYVKESTVMARRYLGTFYWATVIISILAMFGSMYLYQENLLDLPFIPIIGIILIGELYFYLDGITKAEAMNAVAGEADAARSVYDYSKLRKILRKLFGDKVLNEDTTAHSMVLSPATAEDLINKYLQSDSRPVETYGRYMDKYRLAGFKIDQNYLASGLELLQGKSILFNNPFYYDLIPYVFYAMNHKLLAHKKTLIILGRHGIENDIADWCEAGLRTITNVAGMWRIGILNDTEQDLDVGIIVRSDVQNLEMHKANRFFFEDTEYVLLVEPSKIISTAQIGLNSIIRRCKFGEDKHVTFCSTDKNCDGLIDALSHATMTSLCEVSSTEVHEGVNSYMCWTTDGEYLQHRMLPNISRYLGVGTELSFVALKNNISKVSWFGGERFPVLDMHWIAKQYYGKLLKYAGLTESQELFDDVFHVTPNMWNARKKKNYYFTVEDESNNLFEMKREFATRATEQSFVNIITSPYLLCDYMAENEGIFNADPKAIPYIVADYTSTRRNVLFRLCVQMASGSVWESDFKRELLLANAYGEDMIQTFWENLCAQCNELGVKEEGTKGKELHHKYRGKEAVFTSEIILKRRKYNIQTGKEEIAYCIENAKFINEVLGELSNARYIAEEEGDNYYIGAEILGQIFQRYLPGQFFTLSGKYYEMLDVTYDGRILVRRASDHINGRPVYRQERVYSIGNIREDAQMGSQKTFESMTMTRRYADISINTPAYWDMKAYQDFETARRVQINGIPERIYNNKMFLQITFPGVDQKVRYTLTTLMNEVFRSLYAENQEMIVAVTKGEPGTPLTYGLMGDCDDESIYIIEDCQYDIGLLTAVERNINRIFQIICDYLQWNQEAIERSIKEADEKNKPNYAVDQATLDAEEQEQKAANENAPKKKNIFGRIIDAIKNLFKKKPKGETPKDEPAEGEGAKPEGEATKPEGEEGKPEAESQGTEQADGQTDGTEEESAQAETAEDKASEQKEEPQVTEKKGVFQRIGGLFKKRPKKEAEEKGKDKEEPQETAVDSENEADKTVSEEKGEGEVNE